MIKDFGCLDKVDKMYPFSGISYKRIVQEKDPGNRDSFVQLVQFIGCVKSLAKIHISQ